MKHIFISHSPKDVSFVKKTLDALIQTGFKPWIDPHPRPGQDWRIGIDEAIAASDAMIVILSPNAVESMYVTYEWALALGMGIRVFPIMIKPAKLHPRLTSLDKFDLSAWTDERHFWDHFLREFKRLLYTPSAPAPEAAPPSPMPSSAAPAPPAQPAIPSYERRVMPTDPGHWLVVRRGPRLHEMFHLEKSRVSIGRDAANDFSINDPEVSRYHMRFSLQNDQLTVEDLGSTNGTAVNGVDIEGIHPVHPDDTIMVGDTIMLSYHVI